MRGPASGPVPVIPPAPLAGTGQRLDLCPVLCCPRKAEPRARRRRHHGFGTFAHRVGAVPTGATAIVFGASCYEPSRHGERARQVAHRADDRLLRTPAPSASGSGRNLRAVSAWALVGPMGPRLRSPSATSSGADCSMASAWQSADHQLRFHPGPRRRTHRIGHPDHFHQVRRREGGSQTRLWRARARRAPLPAPRQAAA
jgi:hypothetical protein